MKFEILATDRISKTGLAPLRDDPRFNVTRIHDSSSDEFFEALAVAHALIVRSATKVTATMLDQAPNLRAVGRAGVGVDNIDVAAASERGLPVFNSPGGNTVAAAELTMALMLSLARRVTEADHSVRAGNWDRPRFRGVELRGKKLGLIGAGRIGGEVARRCRVFGMDVIAYDPYLHPGRAAELDVRLVDLDELLTESDVISLHVPLTDETRRLIDERAFNRMKKKAFVINASRGGVIDERALAGALERGELGGAALDVYEVEPLPADSPLRGAPNLVLTPHLGASTAEAQVEVAREVSTAILRALLEGDVSGAINVAEMG